MERVMGVFERHYCLADRVGRLGLAITASTHGRVGGPVRSSVPPVDSVAARRPAWIYKMCIHEGSYKLAAVPNSETAAIECPSIDAAVRMVASRHLGAAADADSDVAGALREASGEQKIKPGMAMRCARLLLGADQRDDAELVYTALATHQPTSPSGLVGLAKVAMRRRDWNRALDLWDQAVARFPANRQADWAVGRATCALEIDGATDGTFALALEALESFPDDVKALILAAQIATARGEHGVALSLWRKYRGLVAQSAKACVPALECAIKCADHEFAREIVASASDAVSSTPEFRYRVQLRLHQLTFDEDVGLQLLDAATEADIDPGDIARIGLFLAGARQAPRAVEFLGRAIERHPSHAVLVNRYLTAVYLARGVVALREEKERILPGLSPEDADSWLRATPTLAALSGGELNRIFENAIIHQEKGAAFISKFLLSDEPDVITDCADRLSAVARPSFRLVGRLLAARQNDARRLSRLKDPRSEWDLFRLDAGNLVMSVDEHIASMIEDNDGSPEMLEAMATLPRITGRAGVSWLNSRESYYDAASFADWFAQRVRARQPTALVRLGDGEGNFLPYPSQRAGHQRLDQRGIQLGWWGEEKFSGPSADALSALLQGVIARADAVGIASAGRIVALLNLSGSLTRQSRGWVATYEYLDQVAPELLADKVLTSINVPVDLDQWDLYGKIFSAASAVSVVSCHDLAGFLGETFGVSVRRWFEIPEVKRFSAMFGRADAPPTSTFHPHLFNEIMSEISPIPGEVVLIGAGILGKIIADRVRERGGAALDIGSLADYWAGYTTRAHARSRLRIDSPAHG